MNPQMTGIYNSLPYRYGSSSHVMPLQPIALTGFGDSCVTDLEGLSLLYKF